MTSPGKKAAARKPGAAKRGRRRWFGRGSLWLIVVLFLGSAGLRIVETAGRALALDSGADHGAAAAAGTDCVTEPGVMALFEELRAREKRLDEREGLLQDRDQAIRLAEARIETRLQELVKAEESLAATVEIADKAADADVTRLVALYEQMKPKEAAPLFSEMAPEFAAGFLARMKPSSAAAVLAALDPKTAYTISVLMAGRNAGAPKD